MLSTHELADLYAYPAAGRPWVRSNFVASIDGAAQGADGLSGNLGGEPDARVFRALRDLCDVVVVGAGTARDEGYHRIDGGVLVLVSRSLDIPESLLSAGVVVITTDESPVKQRARIAKRVEVLVLGQSEVDWPEVFAEFARRGWNRVLVEGGPSLHGALIQADLVDEVCLTVSPHLIAGDQLRIAQSTSPVLREMRLGHAVTDEGVLLTRWVRERP
ncbi:MAG TPA: dihydrofolate reductase family protein [Aeromicrobium sp.]|nr:dihydrofolate reductase family protein [Aeromicrobium sp.]